MDFWRHLLRKSLESTSAEQLLDSNEQELRICPHLERRIKHGGAHHNEAINYSQATGHPFPVRLN